MPLIVYALILSILIEVYVVIKYIELPILYHFFDCTSYSCSICIQYKTNSVINNSQPHSIKNLHHLLGCIVCISIIASGHLDNIELLISGIA